MTGLAGARGGVEGIFFLIICFIPQNKSNVRRCHSCDYVILYKSYKAARDSLLLALKKQTAMLFMTAYEEGHVAGNSENCG